MVKQNGLADLFPDVSDIPEAFRPAAESTQRDYLINGEIRHWPGSLLPVTSPLCTRSGGQVTPVVMGYIPRLDSRTAMQALNAAVAAYDRGQGDWPRMPVMDRIRRVERFLEELSEHRDAVVKGLMWEVGKNLTDARREFDRTCRYIRETVEELRRLDQQPGDFGAESGTLAQLRRLPVGVVLCMGPYNYPFYETISTVIPALIMGNAVVFKPARYGVLLIGPVLGLFQRCFPPGAINVIYGKGREILGALMASGDVDLFAFVGTYKAAMALSKLHPNRHRLRSVLGLDAKNPGVILPDADLFNAVKECLSGALSFNGQRCTALKLLFVHESVVDEFLKQLCAGVDALKVGMPWVPEVQVTPLPEAGKVEFLGALIADAVDRGARVINRCGGEYSSTLFRPAVLYPVNPLMRVYQEEQSGPLIPVVPYKDIDDVVEYVTDADYGQQMSIFGQDPAAVAELVNQCVNQVGRININVQCQRGPDTLPFKGRKDSAEGALSVPDALWVFSTRTLIAMALNEENRALVNGLAGAGGSGSRTDQSIL